MRHIAGVRTSVDGLLTRWFATRHFGYRRIGALLLPVVVSQACLLAIAAISPIFVAPVGINAISAVSTVESINVLVLSVLTALGTAGSVVVAQFVGSGERGAVPRAAAATLWAVVAPAAVAGVTLAALHDPLTTWLLGGAGADVVTYGQVYLLGSACSYPAYALVESCSAALRGVARTSPALVLTAAMNGGFLALAAVLVYGFDLGVTGLAIAVAVSRYATAILAVWVLRREPAFAARRAWPWPPRLAMMRRAYVVGAPFVAEQAFFAGGKVIIQLLVVSMGTPQVVSNAVVMSLVGLSEFLPQAMSVVLVPIVGQAVGAGHLDDARRLIRSFIWASSAVAVLGSALMLFTFDWWLGLYDAPPEVDRRVLAIFLMVSAARLVGVWALSFVLPSGLRAAGDAAFTTAVATATMTMRVVFCWLVGVYLGFGVVGVWAVMVSEWGMRAAAFAVRFRGARWERRSLVRPPVSSPSGTA